MTGSQRIVIATSIPPKLSRQNAGRPIDAEYQALCVRSWAACGFRILSVNDREEIPALAPLYPEVEFVATDRNASAMSGRKNPYLADLLQALAGATEPVAGIVNSDLVFEPSVKWQAWMPHLTGKTVVTGQRLDATSLLDGTFRRYYWGFDYFFFDRIAVEEILAHAMPFAMGLPWWDYWLPAALNFTGRRVLTLERPGIVHLIHKQAYVDDVWRHMAREFASFVARAAKERSHTAALPELLAIIPLCNDITEMFERAPGANTEFDQSISRLAMAYVPTIRTNVVNLDPDERMPEMPPGHANDLTPQNVFQNLRNRLTAGHALERAKWLAQNGKANEAEPVFRAALEQTPSDFDVQLSYGEHLVRAGNAQAGMRLLRRAAEQQPKSPAVMNGLALAMKAMKQHESAVACLEEAMRAAPDHTPTYCNLAATLYELGRPREAMSCLEKGLAVKPDFPEAAEMYFHMNRDFRARSGLPIHSLGEYFGQRGEDALLDAFFDFKDKGFFVDIGAFDGVHLSNSYAFERRGWSGLCVEAAPRYFEMLAKNRPGSTCRNVACAAMDSEAVEFRFERGGLFSGTRVDEGFVANTYANAQTAFEGFEIVQVPSATLNTLLGDRSPTIDFVSIDVEGSELDVLAGFDLERFCPRVLLLEATTGAERDRLDTFLAPRGYRRARSIMWNHFYVRNDEDFRALRAITVSAKLARPPHPLGEAHSRFGYPPSPYVFWPAGAAKPAPLDAARI